LVGSLPDHTAGNFLDNICGSDTYLDAILAGANEFDTSDIAKVIERRPRPSYEERMAVFSPTGRPEPSREPFSKRPTG
jgi:hypothetical protein